jgi:hypothetical protein
VLKTEKINKIKHTKYGSQKISLGYGTGNSTPCYSPCTFFYRVTDPNEFGPDPNPTFEKKPHPDSSPEKNADLDPALCKNRDEFKFIHNTFLQ